MVSKEVKILGWIEAILAIVGLMIGTLTKNGMLAMSIIGVFIFIAYFIARTAQTNSPKHNAASKAAL